MASWFDVIFGAWRLPKNRRSTNSRSIGFTATMEKKARISASVVSKVIITLSLVFTVGAIVIVGNTAGVSPPLPVEWDYQAPTAVFGAMTMIALIDVIFPPSKLTLQRKLAPVTLTLSLMGLVSYGLRAAKLAGPRFVPLSGLVMLPIRYLEWSCSTPLLVLLSALMVDAPVKVTVRVMAFDFLTILAGAIGLTLPFPARIFMTVIACFLAALWVLGFGRLLIEAYSRAQDRESRVRVSFVAWASLVLMAGYPVVYILHAERAISLENQEYAYATMDISAKVLLTVVLTNGSFMTSERFIEQQIRRSSEELIFLNTVVRSIRRPTETAKAAISDIEQLLSHAMRRTEEAKAAATSAATAAASMANPTSPSPPGSEPGNGTETKDATAADAYAPANGDSRAAAAAASASSGKPHGGALTVSERSTGSSFQGHLDVDAVVATLYSAVTQIKKSIMDAIFFVALQAGVIRTRTTPLRIDRLLSDARKSLRSALLRRGIELITTVTDRAPTLVEGDAGQLEYVLTLVCTNSVFSAPRGSKVEIKVDEAPADTTATGILSARITVSDIGQRISTDTFEDLADCIDPGPLGRRAAALLSAGREGSEAEYFVASRLLSRQNGSLRVRNLDAGVARHILEIPLCTRSGRFDAQDLARLEEGAFAARLTTGGTEATGFSNAMLSMPVRPTTADVEAMVEMHAKSN